MNYQPRTLDQRSVDAAFGGARPKLNSAMGREAHGMSPGALMGQAPSDTSWQEGAQGRSPELPEPPMSPREQGVAFQQGRSEFEEGRKSVLQQRASTTPSGPIGPLPPMLPDRERFGVMKRSGINPETGKEYGFVAATPQGLMRDERKRVIELPSYEDARKASQNKRADMGQSSRYSLPEPGEPRGFEVASQVVSDPLAERDKWRQQVQSDIETRANARDPQPVGGIASAIPPAPPASEPVAPAATGPVSSIQPGKRVAASGFQGAPAGRGSDVVRLPALPEPDAPAPIQRVPISQRKPPQLMTGMEPNSPVSRAPEMPNPVMAAESPAPLVSPAMQTGTAALGDMGGLQRTINAPAPTSTPVNPAPSSATTSPAATPANASPSVNGSSPAATPSVPTASSSAQSSAPESLLRSQYDQSQAKVAQKEAVAAKAVAQTKQAQQPAPGAFLPEPPQEQQIGLMNNPAPFVRPVVAAPVPAPTPMNSVSTQAPVQTTRRKVGPVPSLAQFDPQPEAISPIDFPALLSSGSRRPTARIA